MAAAMIPMSSANPAAPSQTAIQRGSPVCGPATQAATRAVDPMSTPPNPGTAVN